MEGTPTGSAPIGDQGGAGAPPTLHSDADWEAIEHSPEFQELLVRRRSFNTGALAFFAVWFGAFLILAAYARGFMNASIYQGFKVGYALALSQIVLTWIIVALYLRQAARTVEPLERRAAERARGADEVGP